MTETYQPRHRAFRAARTRVHKNGFRPRHCAGTSCFHAHPGEPLPRVFPPVVVRQTQRGAA